VVKIVPQCGILAVS